jgi:hypothetical protein
MERIRKTLFLIPLIITSVFGLLKCSKDDSNNGSDNQILIGNDIFQSYPNDPLIITEATITGDYLKISFGASGCDGTNWRVNLVGSPGVLFSLPPQREIRLSLKNNEICSAALGKTILFDLKPARTTGNQIVLNLAGWDKPLLYNY